LTTIFTDHSERQKALGIWGATSGIAVPSAITGGALLEHFWYDRSFSSTCPSSHHARDGHFLIRNWSRSATPFRLEAYSSHRRRDLLCSPSLKPQWDGHREDAGCFACLVLAVFTVVELHTEKPLLDVRCSRSRASPPVPCRSPWHFSASSVHLPDHQYFNSEGLLDSLCWCAHAPLRHRGTIFTPSAP